MRALLYLSKRTFMNKLQKALKKPVSLILIIFGVFYGIVFVITVGKLLGKLHFDSVKGLIVIITIWTVYGFLLSFLGYASRKGVIFLPSHTQFVFPAPISPKLILVHGAWMNYLLSVTVSILFVIGGFTVFGVAPWRLALFFLFGCVLEIVLELSTIVVLYTNDRISEKMMKWLSRGMKAFLLGVTLFMILYFKRYGLTLDTASAFIDWKGLQMIPVVGWNISVYRLILLGPDTLNVICSVLYFVFAIAMSLAAWRMKCRGGYYEDAAKFADDYAELKKRKASGEMILDSRKAKRKYRKVQESIKATGAKAIFYRQLLEYKKEKYFIFSKVTLFYLAGAILLSRILLDSVMKAGVPQVYLMGIILYVTFLMSSYVGKWEAELKNPYLFMIPDNPVRKLWYATLIEHGKALIDACVFCIPFGIAWKFSPVQVVLAILTYAILQMNKVFTKVVSQCIFGDTLGRTGQNLVRSMIQMAILGIGAAVASVVGFYVNKDLVFPIILIYSIIVTIAIGLLASIRFHSMEQLA